MLLTLFRRFFEAITPTAPALRNRALVVYLQDAPTAVTIHDSPLEIRTRP